MKQRREIRCEYCSQEYPDLEHGDPVPQHKIPTGVHMKAIGVEVTVNGYRMIRTRKLRTGMQCPAKKVIDVHRPWF